MSVKTIRSIAYGFVILPVFVIVGSACAENAQKNFMPATIIPGNKHCKAIVTVKEGDTCESIVTEYFDSKASEYYRCNKKQCSAPKVGSKFRAHE